MREYSQTYGSFTRTGDYPLEANYIFQTEQELIDFYQDREDNLESTTLHQGLLKVVGEGDNQALYWVILKSAIGHIITTELSDFKIVC